MYIFDEDNMNSTSFNGAPTCTLGDSGLGTVSNE